MPTPPTGRSRSPTPPPASGRGRSDSLSEQDFVQVELGVTESKYSVHGASPARAARQVAAPDLVRWHPMPVAMIPRHAPHEAAAALQDALTTHPRWQDRLQEDLYRVTDRITFRGALAPVLSGCAKWAAAGKAGSGTSLEGWVGPAIAASLAQLLAGVCLSGDRQHGFHWMGSLRPSPDLAPPPSVALWGLCAPEEDQDRLRRIDQLRLSLLQGRVSRAGRRTDDPTPLDAQKARLGQRLQRDRDWLDMGSALAMFGALAGDLMAAAAAQEDQDAGRLSSSSLHGILGLLLAAFLLDAAAGLWQMSSRQPRAEDYPRPAPPPPVRDWAPAAAPSLAALRPADAPGPAAGRPQFDPR